MGTDILSLMTTYYLSEKEKDVLEKILKEGNLSKAAKALGISESTASMRMRRLKDRYSKAKEFIEAVDYYKRKMPGRYI